MGGRKAPIAHQSLGLIHVLVHGGPEHEEGAIHGREQHLPCEGLTSRTGLPLLHPAQATGQLTDALECSNPS